MKDWHTLIGAVILGAAIIAGAWILSDSLRYLGDAINAGLALAG